MALGISKMMKGGEPLSQVPLGVGSAVGAGAEPGLGVLPPSAKLVLLAGPSHVQGDEIRSTCSSRRSPLGWMFSLRPPFPFLRVLTSKSWREQKANHELVL